MLTVRGLPRSQSDEKFATFQTFETSSDFVTPAAEAATGATPSPYQVGQLDSQLLTAQSVGVLIGGP